MKTKSGKIAGIIALLFTALSARANIVITGANGTDGALNITTDTVIDLSQAPTAAWDSDNSVFAGKGVYDSNKWAVVFKFSSINIASGATVTFKNHPSRAPVVWLVTGDVQIAGNVSLDGQTDLPPPQLSEPGPGGFRGGSGYYSSGVGASAGFGPGGGFQGSTPQNQDWRVGKSGSYGTLGDYAYPNTYGNLSLIPLIGGSGGAGWAADGRGGGAAGGGAILLAVQGTINLTGQIHANGGVANQAYCCEWWGRGNGSGGGIRLVCANLTGNGTVNALGGSYWVTAGNGRIRIERNTTDGGLLVAPDASLLPLQASDTPLLWMPADGPSVRVVSVGGKDVPADPRSTFGVTGADVTLPPGATTTVVVETANVEDASQVIVRVAPRNNGTYTETVAAVSQVVSTSPSVLRWSADVPVVNGYSAMQVKVVRP
jgi:hypothetical protein